MNLRTQLLTCAAAALFVLAPNVEAQSRSTSGSFAPLGYVDGGTAKAKSSKKAKAQDDVNLYELKEILAGLEAGRASLEKLGDAKQAKQMAKTIEKLKKKFETSKAKAESKAAGGRQMGVDYRGLEDAMDMSDLGMRMKAVAVAREFYQEAGWGTATRQLGALLECGRLIEAGADGDKIMEVYAGAPSVDERIEMLDRAAAGLKEAGKVERAMLCGALSKWYAGKRDTVLPPGTKEVPLRPQAGDAPAQPRQPRALRLDQRKDRIEILGFARDAHLAGGSREAADKLAALMRLGELQEKGASDEEISRAAPQNTTMTELVTFVRQAVPVLEQAGEPAKAKACRALVEFYVKRDGLAAGGGAGATDRAPQSGRSTGTYLMTPPKRGGDSMEARLDALQRQIEELRRAVAEMRGGQRRR